MPEGRVLVIGLDGATFDLLGPFMEQGVMPFLAQLAAQGAQGALRSTIPPVSAPAWASFMTGVNPGRHGIYEFVQRRPGSFSQTPVNATMVAAPTLWQRLSEGGLRVGAIGVPLTYPPTPVRGFMIGGFLTPRGARDFTYPAELLGELEAALGPYPLHHRQVYARGKVDAVLEEARAILEYRLRSARYLLRRGDWDLAVLYIHGTDRVQHELWHILDETHPHHDAREASRYREQVLAFYRAVDDATREVAGLAPPGTTVVVLSDHGFGPVHKFVNFNVWLMQEGFLKLKHDVATRLKHLAFRSGLTPALAYRIAMRFGLAQLRLAAGLTKRAYLLSLLERTFLSLSNVDWQATVAYSRGNYGQMFVNLEGREMHGIVPRAEFEAVREEIIERLRGLRDPETGAPVIAQVLRTEAVYEGPHVAGAADLIPLTQDMRHKALGTVSFTSHRLVEPTFGNSGDHRMEGILIASGPAIRPSQELSGARIVDLAPTLLHLLGQPVPAGLDGRVLEEMLDPAYLAAHPIRWGTDEAVLPVRPSEGYTQDEEAEVLEQLRNLGYVA